MSFQWIFDNAESIGVRKRANVAQTITRGNVVRSVSRGGDIHIFTVKLPDGMPWDQVASNIQAIDAAGRFTQETITLNNPGYASWIHNGVFSDPNKTWNVICVEMPDWTIFARNQVSWSGDFVFYEVVA